MANSPQARKRARQNETRREHNTALKSDMRTAIKKTLKAIKDGSKETATSAYHSMVSKLDRMARKNVIHPNRAARLKSRVSAKIKAL